MTPDLSEATLDDLAAEIEKRCGCFLLVVTAPIGGAGAERRWRRWHTSLNAAGAIGLAAFAQHELMSAFETDDDAIP